MSFVRQRHPAAEILNPQEEDSVKLRFILAHRRDVGYVNAIPRNKDTLLEALGLIDRCNEVPQLEIRDSWFGATFEWILSFPRSGKVHRFSFFYAE